MAVGNIQVKFEVDATALQTLHTNLAKLGFDSEQIQKEFAQAGLTIDKVSNEATADVKKVDAAVNQLVTDTKKVGTEFEEAGKKTKKAAKESGDSFGGLAQAVKGVGAAIAASFALDSIASFGKKIIETTSQFQAFRVVLANSFQTGGRSIAEAQQLASETFDMITEFAAKTPFQVKEVTDAFIRLANQGIVLTRSELVKMGDLAATINKPLTQVSEAIIDAQTGHNQRLEELGVKVEDAGNKWQYTFKGMTVEVDKNAEAIKNQIIAFGELEGVVGATEKLSQTLGGQLSNLSDGFDRLLVAIGDVATDGGKGGAMGDLIAGMQFLIEKTAQSIKGFGAMTAEYPKISQFFKDVAKDALGISFITDVFGAMGEAQKKQGEIADKNKKASADEAESFKKYLKERAASETEATERMIVNMLSIKQLKEQAAHGETTLQKQLAKERLAQLKEDEQRQKEVAKVAKDAQKKKEDEEKAHYEHIKRIREISFQILQAQTDDAFAKEMQSLEHQRVNALQELDNRNITTEQKEQERLAIMEKYAVLINELNEKKPQKIDFGIQTKDIIEGIENLKPVIEAWGNDYANAIDKVTNKTGELTLAQQDTINKLTQGFGVANDITTRISGLVSEIKTAQDKEFQNEVAKDKTKTEERLESIDKQRDKELARAGKDTAKRAAIEKKYEAQRMQVMEESAKKQEELEKKQKERQKQIYAIQKAIAIAITIINTLQAAMAAMAPPPIGLGPVSGLPLAVAIGVMGAANVVAIAAQPDSFAKGTLSLGGKTDSDGGIIIRAHKDEAIIPAQTNKDYAATIAAVYNKQVPADVLNQFALEYQRNAGEHNKLATLRPQIIDTQAIMAAMNGGSGKNVNISILADSEGLKTYFETVNEKINIQNTRYNYNV